LLSNWRRRRKEPLGSRILVGYDNAHGEQVGRGLWGGGLRDGQRGRKGDGALKEEEEEDEVVVSADGWAGGLLCNI